MRRSRWCDEVEKHKPMRVGEEYSLDAADK
jgi:hypothetical protein